MAKDKDNIINFGNDACAVVEKKEVGTVTPRERDEIKILFERKNGISELTRSLINVPKAELENSFLYDKLISDMGKASSQFQKWWDTMKAKYNWETLPGYRWEIDFETCKIYIKKQ
ncbi:MAG: CXXX repeat peptide modification system protein [Spirochaetales bacterium]|nr:CXXX repeat peptide modification system protein [Spirochaetales bacterium]